MARSSSRSPSGSGPFGGTPGRRRRATTKPAGSGPGGQARPGLHRPGDRPGRATGSASESPTGKHRGRRRDGDMSAPPVDRHSSIRPTLWSEGPCRRSQVRAGFGLQQGFDQAVEVGTVVHMDPVRDLVRDGRPPHPIGREDEAPAVANPAAEQLPQRERGRRCRPGLPSLRPWRRIPRSLRRTCRARGDAASEQPRFQALLRAAGDQPSLLQPGRRGRSGLQSIRCGRP